MHNLKKNLKGIKLSLLKCKNFYQLIKFIKTDQSN